MKSVDRMSWTRSIVALLALAVLAAGAAAEVESAPIFRASEILPPELAESGDHRVVELVHNDGFMHRFEIRSEFGDFDARGEPMLAIRVHEVHALAQLDELSKTEVFADAVARAARGQGDAVKEFADRPVETVKGIPGGVKRMFRSYKRDAKEVKEEVDEAREDEEPEEGDGSEDDEADSEEDGVGTGKYAKRYLGLNRAEMRWYQQLQVDPYTTNEILRKEIKEVARVDAAGSFGMRFAPIPRIPGVNYLSDVAKIVWTMDPRELVELNMKKLAEMGAREELIDELVENPAITPSYQTAVVVILGSLEGAGGRVSLVEQAAGLETEEQAIFFVQSLSQLGEYHASATPIERLVGRTRVPVALTRDGKLVGFASVDHLSWTEEASDIAEGFHRAYADVDATRRELRLRGTASELAREQLGALGWTVVERVPASSTPGAAKSPS